MALPPSKKTRGLLAYLAVTGRAHRRDRLCTLLWDVADDPRAALRWSLSKLRSLVDEPGRRRIVADRENVALDCSELHVDLVAAKRRLSTVDDVTTEELEKLVSDFRGEFLEGLELSDFHEFQAWCMAVREEARTLHVRGLATLLERLSLQPERMLPHARRLAAVDPYDLKAHTRLLEVLVETGRWREAEQHLESARRLLGETGATDPEALAVAWRTLQSARAPAAPPPTMEPDPPSETRRPGTPTRVRAHQPTPLVGRDREYGRLLAAIQAAELRQRERVVLVTGEPGIGKSRLLNELIAATRERSATVLAGRAYEAEHGRPYGPWIDALRGLHPTTLGSTIAAELALLLPELSPEDQVEHSRDRLFGGIVELIAARAHSEPPVLVVLDDVQWCDPASAELLHYVARMCRHRPLLIALAARPGELPDNEPVLRVVRSLRRQQLLEELPLEALNREATAALIRTHELEVDVDRVHGEASGNPLFALELARSLAQREDAPRGLAELVRDRIDHLPPAATEMLRWAAVLGSTFSEHRLSELAVTDLDGLISTLEVLERHALIHPARAADRTRGGAYTFSHDVVRHVVYADISEPRRRLMHSRIAGTLATAEETDPTLAGDLAHHAVLAGDLDMAARACVRAGEHCLRLFANDEAFTLARRGRQYAECLDEPERTKLNLELIKVSFAARRPRTLDEAATLIEQLAERALDHGCMEHARLGFHMLSYLRWEGGEWSDAERQTLRAELVSRTTNGKERIVAMAEAARCLAMLERDLGQAEALALEAGALSSRVGVETTAVPDALGMLRLHQGELDLAARHFQDARVLSRRDGDRLGEFQALEHLVMLELQRGSYAEAGRLATELVTLGEKFREGSEAPFARVLAALVAYARGDADGHAQLDEWLEALRRADAKHRLAYSLTRAAEIDLRCARSEIAGKRAAEALAAAEALGRPSEIVLARLALARIALARDDADAMHAHIDALANTSAGDISSHAREALARTLADLGTAPRAEA